MGRGGRGERVVPRAHVTPVPGLLRLRHRAGRRAADLPRRRCPPRVTGTARVAAPWVPDDTAARRLPRVRRPRPSRVPGRHLVGARLRRRLGRRHHRAADGARPDDRGHRRPAGAGRAARRHRRAPRGRGTQDVHRARRCTTPTAASWAGPSTCGSPWTRPQFNRASGSLQGGVVAGQRARRRRCSSSSLHSSSRSLTSSPAGRGDGREPPAALLGDRQDHRAPVLGVGGALDQAELEQGLHLAADGALVDREDARRGRWPGGARSR